MQSKKKQHKTQNNNQKRKVNRKRNPSKSKRAIKDNEKKEQKHHTLGIPEYIAIFLVLIVIGLLIGSFIKYMLPSIKKKPVEEFNGFKFYKTAKGIWTTEFTYNNKTYVASFRYSPMEVFDLDTPKNVKFLRKLSKIYLIVEPNIESTYVIGMVDIAKVLANVFNVEVISGVSAENKNNVSILRCENISGIGIFYTKNNATNKVYWRKNCLIINTTEGWNAVKFSDKIAYQILGIMN